MANTYKNGLCMCYLGGEIFLGDFDAEIDEFVLSLPSSWYSKLAGISLAR